jgi:hypothetical protein
MHVATKKAPLRRGFLFADGLNRSVARNQAASFPLFPGVRRDPGRSDFAPAPQLNLEFALAEPLLAFLAAFSASQCPV